MSDPEIERWIEQNFAGHGRALRTLQEPPIDGEPFMSMEDAKQLLREGIARFSPPVSTADGATDMRKSESEQNADSKTWTAGIDVLRQYSYQDRQWHLSAIEFHHKVKEDAEALRDKVFAALTALAAQADAQGGEVVAWQETAASWLERKAELATNSLHCGDSSMTIHSTHRYAAGLMALAKEIRETATPSLSIEPQSARKDPTQ